MDYHSRSLRRTRCFGAALIASLFGLTLASSNVIAADLSIAKLATSTINLTAATNAKKGNRFTPQASEVFIQRMDASRTGNALISVKYDAQQWTRRKQEPPEQINIVIGKQATALYDNGSANDSKAADGIYSAVVEFDFDALIASYQRVADLGEKFGKKDGAVPIQLKGREILGPLKTLSLEELTRAIKEGAQIPLNPLGIAAVIDSEKSLLIRHSNVVQDPSRTFDVCTGTGDANGVWTFKHLITEMANTSVTGVDYEDFTRLWLEKWEKSQMVNGWTVADRQAIRNKIIIPWENASGGAGSTLDLDKAPFQLLAIVNRIDLRDNSIYGSGNAGEARFVFQAMDMTQNCAPMQFTTIFEYGIDKNSCPAVKNWGQRWADLSNFSLGSSAYNDALENITESFVTANAAPNKPNGSALNQLRTNEVDLAFPWQLREFRISNTHWDQYLLRQNTVALTPDNSLDNSTILADFVNGNGGTSSVDPQRFPSITDPFLGGSSEAISPTFFWKSAGITSNQARHEFSLNTCNGCHAGETNTVFTHVKPGIIPTAGVALSGFLTGIQVTDPLDNSVTRTFNDLQRRAADLDGLLNSSCLAQLSQPTIQAPH